MGKGRFLMELALSHPDVNYIGIERYSSVLLKGLQKRARLELANIFFLCIDARDMADIFAPVRFRGFISTFPIPGLRTATPSGG